MVQRKLIHDIQIVKNPGVKLCWIGTMLADRDRITLRLAYLLMTPDFIQPLHQVGDP